MTSICFKECFVQKNLKIDAKCVKTCYDKYIWSINEIMKITIDEGRRCKSDFVLNAVGTKEDEDHRFMDLAFPIGGMPGFEGEANPHHRLKRFESYGYSGITKSGR